jgi:ABC-2 type transport system permease protein
MRVYWEFAKLVYRRNATYKVQYWMGLFNALLGLLIGVAIWTAAYGDKSMIDNITKGQIVTYVVLGALMRTMLSMNEYLIDSKIRSGEIAVDLLKPYKFLGYVFSQNIGDMVFNIWTKVTPVLVLSFLIFPIVLPVEAYQAVFFFISLILGFFVLYVFNLIFWLSAFWFHQTWSLITIKNAIILLLSGATIPLWFLPEQMEKVLSYLPFKDIYFTPLSIYLGKMPVEKILNACLSQLVWIAALSVVAWLMWRKAQQRLVIQGG